MKASLYINKLAAAERQLNAAIRMSLAGEDDLAIHTVAAGAYRLLRDLKQKRGRSELRDMFGRGIHALAHDLASGRLQTIPPELANSSELVTIVTALVGHIKEGNPFTLADSSRIFQYRNEMQHWQNFNRTANFLKHADNDAGELLEIDGLKHRNQLLLLSTSAAYIDLVGHSTPEIEVFGVFVWGGDEGFSTPFFRLIDSSAFKGASLARRRQICKRLLRILKEEGLHREYREAPDGTVIRAVRLTPRAD